MKPPIITHHGYCPGHPWYYLLGGVIFTPKQIRAQVKFKDHRSYKTDDYLAIANRSEPQRSQKLRQIRLQIKEELREDISCYRSLAHQLRIHSEQNPLSDWPICCKDIHSNIATKYNHIFNDFAHLKALDEIPTQQSDLFDAL